MGNGQTSHLSKILTRMCTYLVNVPVLKDHGKVGITLSLKNHYGTIDNPMDCHPNHYSGKGIYFGLKESI
jgi:uncharacterized protein (DUF362 family)